MADGVPSYPFPLPDALSPPPGWARLRSEDPRGVVERLTAWLLRRPAQGLLVGVLAVAGLTGVALVAGPPV